MKEQLNKVLHEAKEKLAEAETQADMEEIRVKMLGKKGKITSMLKSMGKLAPEDRSPDTSAPRRRYLTRPTD